MVCKCAPVSQLWYLMTLCSLFLTTMDGAQPVWPDLRFWNPDSTLPPLLSMPDGVLRSLIHQVVWLLLNSNVACFCFLFWLYHNNEILFRPFAILYVFQTKVGRMGWIKDYLKGIIALLVIQYLSPHHFCWDRVPITRNKGIPEIRMHMN